MRTFKLVRTTDVSGVSGTGIVAEGVEFSSGKCSLAWVTQYRSVAVYDSIHELEAIHGHDGATVIEWDTDSTLARIEATQRDILARLPESAPPVPQPPATPAPPTPEPGLPTLPAKSAAMFVYEDWSKSGLYYESDTAPGIQWVRANSAEGKQGLRNSDLASSDIIDHDGGKVLRLRIAPTGYPQSIGARLVLTEAKRWTALQPYAGKKLYGRLWLMFPTLPSIDEGNGNDGRWCTAGFQIKDDPNISALYQWNVDERLFPFLTYRNGGVAEARTLRPPYKANKWARIDFEWLMTGASEGYFNVSIDGVAAYAVGGRSASVASSFASLHLCLYSDALRAPADLYVRGLVVSTEAIP